MFHMKPRKTNELERWMREHHYSDTHFMQALNAVLLAKGERTISHRSVSKWRRAETIPRPAAQKAIMELTDGKVTPNDFVAALRPAAA
jgi:hypothetical protein